MEWIILGIPPTTDIKTIKKAYAALAKKYNPEEHPEQFKRIHDAYKLACAYASRNNGRTSFPKQTESGAADGFDFSDIGKTSDTGQEKEQEFDFSGINDKSMKESRRYSDIHGDHKDEKKSSGYTYNFSYTDNNDKDRKSYGDNTDYDFSYMDNSLSGKEHKQTYSRAGSKKNTSSDERKTEYDFDYLDTETIKYVLSEITALVGDIKNRNSIDLWKKIFYSAAFKRIAANNNFRCEAREIIYGKMFGRETAEFIADAFGLGSFVIHVHYKPVHEYTVKITAKENPRRLGAKELKGFADRFSKLF